MSKNDLQASALRPGFLVSLHTTIVGNVKYAKTVLSSRMTEEGASVAEWETKRTIFDPEEHKRAVKVRQNARNKVADTCISTNFGLLCPSDRKEQLDEAVAAAREEVRQFNMEAKLSTVRVYVIAGYIADNDEEAIRAITAEVQNLYRAMEQGIEGMDAAAIRDAAGRALKVGRMLRPEANENVQEAVKLAREVARKITKAGESAAQEVDKKTIQALTAKRTAFLDLTGAVEEVDIKGAGRAVDLAPVVEVEEVKAPKAKKAKRAIDLEPAVEVAPTPKRKRRERLPAEASA